MTSLKDVIRLNLRSIIGIANYPRSMYVLGGCLEKGNGFCNVTRQLGNVLVRAFHVPGLINHSLDTVSI